MRVQQAVERDPTSAPRPQFDPEHEALIPAVTGELPVWFVASSQRDFSRVAALASRLEVTDYVFLGGQEGYLATDLLSRLRRPVIVSLDFPDPDDVTGRAFAFHVEPVSGDDTVDEQADSAAARAARGNAATLVNAGISVTLSSYGTSVTEFRGLIGDAVTAGLSEDEALRAVTITPAALLGLGGAIGTIQRGKLANLLVTDGGLFDDDTHVLHVFVEGQRFDYPPVDEAETEGDANNRRGRRGEAR
jgi:imidazolonepropionase-like amidohydrolase